MKTLLSEQRDISLQAAGHSLSSKHLRQRLFVYQRYFIALARCKTTPKSTNVRKSPDFLTCENKFPVNNELILILTV